MKTLLIAHKEEITLITAIILGLIFVTLNQDKLSDILQGYAKSF